MKFTDIKKMQKEELDKKINELKTELMKLNAQVAIGTTPKSTKQIREIKRNLARIETFKEETFRGELSRMTGKDSKSRNHHVKKAKNYIHS